MSKFSIQFDIKCPLCERAHPIQVELDEPNWDQMQTGDQIDIYHDIELNCAHCDHQFLGAVHCYSRRCELILDERPNEIVYSEMP